MMISCVMQCGPGCDPASLGSVRSAAGTAICAAALWRRYSAGGTASPRPAPSQAALQQISGESQPSVGATAGWQDG